MAKKKSATNKKVAVKKSPVKKQVEKVEAKVETPIVPVQPKPNKFEGLGVVTWAIDELTVVEDHLGMQDFLHQADYTVTCRSGDITVSVKGTAVFPLPSERIEGYESFTNLNTDMVKDMILGQVSEARINLKLQLKLNEARKPKLVKKTLSI